MGGSAISGDDRFFLLKSILIDKLDQSSDILGIFKEVIQCIENQLTVPSNHPGQREGDQ
jgi:hypothetical protein